MANTRHPNFILGILSIIVGAAAIGFYANKESSTADVLIIITAVMGVVSWVWSIIEVEKTEIPIGKLFRNSVMKMLQ